MAHFRAVSGSHNTRRTFTPARCSAFTLVELLTVIGIIAVLAAILFPVFATVRGKARQTTCQSNLRQIGMAFQMYISDYDGLIPYARDSSDRAVPSMWSFSGSGCQTKINTMPMIHPWPDATQPGGFENGVLDSYIKSRDIWRCAGDTGFDYLDNNDSCGGPCPMPARPTMYEKYGGSYLFRTSLALAQIPLDNLNGRAPNGQTVGPAGINILFDGNGSWHGSPFALGRSSLRYVTLYGDGHAKFLTNDKYQEAWSTSIVSDPGANPCP
jgi:prepilin-type N-terminal cleavage/methylation domain-containing protein